MTSQCRPFDQGITQQFKKLYRSQLLCKTVADLDADNDDSSQPINVSNAIYWVSSATKKHLTQNSGKMFLAV